MCFPARLFVLQLEQKNLQIIAKLKIIEFAAKEHIWTYFSNNIIPVCTRIYTVQLTQIIKMTVMWKTAKQQVRIVIVALHI